MEKNYEQKRNELNQRFEDKKTNFLNMLVGAVDSLKLDLEDMTNQFNELSTEEKESKKVAKKETKPKK